MASPILVLVKMLLNPDVSNKVILQLAYRQMSALGWARVLSALLGAGVVGALLVVKIPQIKKILNPKTLDQRIAVANGLALEGISLETFNYLIHCVFNAQNNSLFISYGESFLLGLQNVAIILLINYYRARKSGEIEDLLSLEPVERVSTIVRKLAKPIGLIAGSTIFFSKLAPRNLISFLQVLGIPILILSKLPQVEKNHRLQSTAHLLNLTLRANWLGSVIRVYTSLQDYSAKSERGKNTLTAAVLLTGYSALFIVNLVLVAQSYYYGAKEEDKVEKKD